MPNTAIPAPTGGVPTTALKGPLGGGYGPSNITDPASGKPLLTYINPEAKASQLLSDRVAPTFDPTVPQKLDSSVLQNGRMPESVSQAIKAQFPGSTADELDHIMPLELGGSNNKSNLRLEPPDNTSKNYNPSSNPTNTDPLENALAKSVQSGSLSLADAWKAMAKAKGVTLPEQGGTVPNSNNIQPNTQPNEQPQPSLLDKIKSGASTFIDDITHPLAGDPGQTMVTKFPSLTQSLADLQTNPLSLGSSIEDIVKTPFTDVMDASNAFNNTVANFIQGIKSKAPASQDISNGLQMATALTSGMLTPITTWFNVANKIPIVGSVSKLIFNLPFSALGDLSGDTGVQVLTSLSKSNGGPIDDNAVANLTPGVQAISTLAGQIIAGKYVAPDVLETLSKQFGPIDANAILQKAKELAQQREGFVNYGADVGGGKEETPTEDLNAPKKLPESVDKEHVSESADQGTATAKAQEDAAQERFRQFNEEHERATLANTPPKDSAMQKLQNKLNPLEGQDPDVKKLYQDYISNGQTKARLLANEEGRPLRVIPADEAKDVVDRFERGSPTPYTPLLKDTGAKLLKEVRDAGYDVPERENYIPHRYTESPTEIHELIKKYLTKKGLSETDAEAFLNGRKEISPDDAKRLGINPSLIKDRTFPTYADAEEAGLHRQYTHPSQLFAGYREDFERAKAARGLEEGLVDKGKLYTVKPSGYQAVNEEFSPKGYYAKPRLAQMLNGIFNSSSEKTFGDHFWKTTGAINSTLQKIQLSTGVPATDLNLHAFGQIMKDTAAGDFGKTVSFLRANSDAATVKYFEANKDLITRAANAHLDLGRTVADYPNWYKNLSAPTVSEVKDNFGTASAAKFIADNVGSTFRSVFTKKNFASLMPQLFLSTFKEATERFQAAGIPQDKADLLAAEVTKAYHGIMDDVGQSRRTKDELSTAFYAPEFRSSIMKTLWNTVKSVSTEFQNPAYYKNRNLAAGLIVTYGLYNAANKFFAGHYTWQNPSTHQFDLQIPLGNGQFAYIPYLPTFATIPRNVVGGALSIGQGDLKGATQQFGGLMSSGFQMITELYANKDFYGRQIYSTTGGWQIVAPQIAAYLGLNGTPPWVQEAAKYITSQGQMPIYQAITAGLALPIKYGTASQNNTSDFYNAVANYQNLHTQALASFKPTFDQIQSLLQSGQQDQAQQALDKLSDSDYQLYKDLKAASTRTTTTKGEAQFTPTYQQIKNLLQQGKTDQAQQILNGLTDQEYKYYQLMKKRGL